MVKNKNTILIISILVLTLLFLFYANREQLRVLDVAGTETCEFKTGSTTLNSYSCLVPDGCYVSIDKIYCNEIVGSNYECRSFYDVHRVDGVESDYIIYNADTPGYYELPESDEIFLSKGDYFTLRFDGVINYKEKICQACECTKDVCSGIGYRTCENINPETGCGSLSPIISYCDNQKICIEDFGECLLPYILYLDLGQQVGISKDTFRPTENVQSRIYIDSKLSGYKTLKMLLYQENVLVDSKSISLNLPMRQGTYKYTDFGRLPLGNYKIVAELDGYTMSRTFAVSDEFVVYAVWEDKTRFITNKDITLALNIYDSEETSRVNIPNWQTNILLEPTLDDLPVQYTSTSPQAGEYKYTFNFDKTGMFKVNFVINHPQYPQFTTGKVHYIQQPSLSITTLFDKIITTGEHDLIFTIRGEDAQPVEPEIINMDITPSSTQISEKFSKSDLIKGDGTWLLKYNFDPEDVYSVKIYVAKDGYSSDSVETLIDVTKPGFCGNGICESTEDEINCPKDCKKSFFDWKNWAIIISVILTIVVIFFLYKSWRKK